MTKRILLAALAGIFLFTIVANAQNEKKIFRGDLAEKLVEMTLERDGNKLTGHYYYDKVKVNIKVSGQIGSDNKFTLQEFSAKGVKTGDFSGEWITESEDGGITLNGTWENPKKTKSYGFYLQEQMIYFTSSASLISRTYSEKNKPKLFEIEASYPELVGISGPAAIKFNQKAKSMVMKIVAEFRKDMMAQTAEDLKWSRERGGSNTSEVGYNIEYADDNLISVWFSHGFYTGGAHPNSYSFTLNFDLKTGKQLTLADLFKPGSKYLKTISDFCINDLKEDMSDMSDDDWIKTGAGPDLKNYGSWSITKKGILITFDSYQVAAYAAGPQEVLIPYDELKSILKPGGVISNLQK